MTPPELEAWKGVAQLVAGGGAPLTLALLFYIISEQKRMNGLLLELSTRVLALEQHVFNKPYPAKR